MKAIIPALIGQRHRGGVPQGFQRPTTASEQKRFGNRGSSSVHSESGHYEEDAGGYRVQRLTETSDQIRQHIARELHDDIGQRLSLLSIKLGLLQLDPAFDDPDNILAESLRDLDALISDVHHLSQNLHSSGIEHLGLQAALKSVIARLPETLGIQVDLFAAKIPEDLPPGLALCFFRVAQESLNNAIKHSGSARVRIELLFVGSKLTMIVQDFGTGFDKNRSQRGLGLITMAERMEAVGGTLEIDTALSVGTIVTATARVRLVTGQRQSTTFQKKTKEAALMIVGERL